MANFEAFRWNFSSSTNFKIMRSVEARKKGDFLISFKKVPPQGNIKIRLVFGLCCIILQTYQHAAIDFKFKKGGDLNFNEMGGGSQIPNKCAAAITKNSRCLS